MPLLLGLDPTGLPHRVAEELGNLIAAIQTWVGREEGQGRWVHVSYNSSHFSASAGTWEVQSGDQRLFAYAVIGDMMTVAFNFVGTSLTGVGNELRLQIPGAYNIATPDFTGFVALFGTTTGIGHIVTRSVVIGNQLSIQRNPVVAWSDSTNGQTVRGTITFQVVQKR